ncbi:MAG: hypothetical protein RIB79_00165 [Allomuricauda sp.]|jgi:hypothetical protein
MKNIRIFIVILGVVFLAIIITVQGNNNDKSLKLESDINLFVNNVKYYKGVVTLEDSISISGNCPLINTLTENDYQPTLGDYSGPYRFIKERYNDTIKIVIINDTLRFKFISMH